MKHKLLLLLSMLFLFCTSNTQAGFRVKKSSPTPELSGTVATAPKQTHVATKKEQRIATVKAIKRFLIHDNGRPGHRRHASESGWEGIVALICGLTYYLFLPAIIFGAIGMGRGHRHRGMA